MPAYAGPGPQAWLLDATERGNPATRLDRRHEEGVAWTSGNLVTPLVHGATYFSALLSVLRGTRSGDLVLFTDWRGDPDQLLAGPGTEISRVLCEAAARGVVVRGLVWRSHWDRLQFSGYENRHLGEQITAAGGECLLDMRVRVGGSHHQKFVVVRHPDRPHLDVAFAGGIDLCHSRQDDLEHLGSAQRQKMAAVYGPRPPWHDVQLQIRGPAVADVETSFRERWDDPAPLSRNPFHRLRDVLLDGRRSLPAVLPDPAAEGPHTVQVLRTYPSRGRLSHYPFAPRGELSVARGYLKALARARRLVYVEDQYLWSSEVVATFAEALSREPDLRMIAVVPQFPDQDGRWSMPPNLVGRTQAMRLLRDAGGDRVAVYSPENHHGTPVYVHAKVCVVDDVWACVGSGNLNRRSWTHDSELSCAVLDTTPDSRTPEDPAGHGDGVRTFALDLRLQLAHEHLDTDVDDPLLAPASAFDAFATSADSLDAWYSAGSLGPRPAGRLRRYREPDLRPRTLLWATPVYRTVYDPDGRPRRARRTRNLQW
jgi:phosphatidylserine/phosphatidylglycerophosphate/cardiolipin synthase-like enzyme